MPNSRELIDKYRAHDSGGANSDSLGAKIKSANEYIESRFGAISNQLEGFAAAATSALQVEIERPNAPGAQMSTSADLADEKMISAQVEALHRYASATLHLNEQKQRGVDITQRAAFAEATLQKNVLDASNQKTRAIHAEANALQRRREAKTGFSRLEDEWRTGMIAGAREQLASGSASSAFDHSRSSMLIDAYTAPRKGVETGGADVVNLLGQILNELRSQTPKLDNMGVLV